MIARNTALNLFGLGTPLIFAIVCIPPLITGLGAARFGLLTLVWAVVSYFGVFDLGLGRAVTLQVASALGQGRADQARSIVGNALLLLLVLGGLAGGVMWFAAAAGVALMGDVPDPSEAIRAARAMAWAMPFVVLTAALRGAMEALGAFLSINLIRVAVGALTFMLPLAVISAGWNDLGAIAWALVGLRALGMLLHGYHLALLLPGRVRISGMDPDVMRRLLAFGGWLTVSNLVGPLMSYLDRFLVGAVLSLAAVAWYVTPQEIVTRLLIVATALSSVLFPRMAELHAAGGMTDAVARIERQGLLVLYLVLFPLTLALGATSEVVLRVWVGEEFARQGGVAMSIFCFGVLLNSLSQVPYAAIQARGRADQTAMLHCIELPLFIVMLYFLALRWGVTGAAAAWTLRIVVDFLALWWLSRGRAVLQPGSGTVVSSGCAGVGVLTVIAFAGSLIEQPILRAVACAVPAALALAWAIWRADLEMLRPIRGKGSNRMEG